MLAPENVLIILSRSLEVSSHVGYVRGQGKMELSFIGNEGVCKFPNMGCAWNLRVIERLVRVRLPWGLQVGVCWVI